MELKPIDEKLIAYLSENAREPLTKIAKSLKLSRDQIEYRINKYYSFGLIKNISAMVNYESLGYNYLIVILIKLTDSGNPEEFLQKLEKNKNCFSAGKVFNKYDFFANMIFINEDDAREKLSKLLESKKVTNYKIIKPFFSELYPLKIVNDKEPIKLISKTEKIKLDKKDLEILKILGKDARAKIIDIANSLNISAELALHRIRKLYSKNIILGYRIHFDYSKFRKFFSLMLIDLKDLSDKTIDKIKKYARNSEIASSANLCLSFPNAFIQIFHKDESELREEIKKLKQLFGESLINIDVLLIEGEKDVNILPFL